MKELIIMSSCNGVVKWFDAKKGYGFLVSDDVDGDVFVHYTKINMEGFKKLETNENVSFDVVTSADGKPQADNVVRNDP
jgi:CspA family cold shock protein